MDETLTTSEAAALLGLTPGRVRALVGRGELPAARFGPALAIRRADVEALRRRRLEVPPGKRGKGRPFKVPPPGEGE